MSLSLPHTLTAGTPENVTHVQENDAYLATQVDTTNTTVATNTTQLEYAYSTYKTILTGGAAAMQFTSSGNFSITGSATLSGGNVFYFDPADFTAGSRTNKYRIRAVLAPNQVAPAITITFSLNPATLSSPGSSGNANSYAFGAAVSGSTVAFASPSASTLAQGNSGDFTAPAAGYYAIAVAASGTAAAGSRVDVSMSLQVRQV